MRMPGKKAVMLGFLAAGYARAAVNLQYPGVVYPSTEQVTWVAYGEELEGDCRALVVDDFGISAVLSFDGEPRQTFVPWGAVFGIDATAIWEDDVPMLEESTRVDAPVFEPRRARPAYLRVV